MYIIINNTNLIVDTIQSISYTRMQNNGTRVLCQQDEAMDIYAPDTDKFYPTAMYTAVKVDELPNSFILGFWKYEDNKFCADPEKIEEIRAYKLTELSAASNTAITNGCDVTLTDGTTAHYALAETDQINISTALAAVQQGAQGFPYHADGELCRLYPAADIVAISNAAAAHKLYHTTYFNHIKAWVNRLETADEISAVTYGSELPENLAANMEAILNAMGI